MTSISLTAAALVIISLACGQEAVLNIFLENKARPSFTFSGTALPIEFEVLELPRTKPLSRTNPFSFKGETIWKISAAEKMKADRWPTITYGEVPKGFSQSIPDHGSPPRLSEDKLYVGRISVNKDSQSVLFFEIRNAKAANVSDQLLGP